jgi:hypothetical protein
MTADRNRWWIVFASVIGLLVGNGPIMLSILMWTLNPELFSDGSACFVDVMIVHPA